MLRLPNLAIIVLIFAFVRFFIVVPMYAQIAQPLAFSHLDYSLLCLAVLCIAAAGYIINDFYDWRIDEINRPGKNPIGTSISHRSAALYALILNSIALAISIYLMDIKIIIIHLLSMFTLWLYSFALKRSTLFGNLAVAILAALLVIETWLPDLPTFYAQIAAKSVLAQESLFVLMMYAGFAFLATLLREVVKDMEDIEGDYQHGRMTFPIIWGMPRTLSLCLGIMAATSMAIWLQTRMLWNGGHTAAAAYTVIALFLPLLFFIFRLRNAKKKADYTRLSLYLKIYMLLGLVLLPVYAFT